MISEIVHFINVFSTALSVLKYFRFIYEINKFILKLILNHKS